jgi:PAB-dependent poly(A)-specific ribonuclease subunit 2
LPQVPAIVYLERADCYDDLDFNSLPNNIDESILMRDTNVAVHRDPSHIKQQYLTEDELPKPGTVVAIDAEFVLMQQVSLLLMIHEAPKLIFT